MKAIKNIGLVLFLAGLALFTGISFIGTYQLSPEAYEAAVTEDTRNKLGDKLSSAIVGKEFSSSVALASTAVGIVDAHNAEAEANQQWDNKVWQTGHKDLGLAVVKAATKGPVADSCRS